MSQFYGRDVTPREGVYVKPDGWRFGNLLTKSPTDFTPLVLPTNSGGPIESVAVRVEVTGRTLQNPFGKDADYVRVRVIFVGDCEPDQETGGWMKIYS